jgi:hypothetical protein
MIFVHRVFARLDGMSDSMGCLMVEGVLGVDEEHRNIEKDLPSGEQLACWGLSNCGFVLRWLLWVFGWVVGYIRFGIV